MAARQRVKDAVSRAEEEQDIFMTRPQGAPDLVYVPTQTSNPSDPRTASAQYWKDAQVLRVEWGDNGTPYQYFGVTPSEARRFIKSRSPGRFINRVLNDHPYAPEG
jgi:hypothetical protein